MLPRRVVPEIRGRVARAYRVRDIAEIDVHLRGLKVWLVDAIDRAPALTRRHVEFYCDDVDALLDARLVLMRRAAPVERVVDLVTGDVTAETLTAEGVA